MPQPKSDEETADIRHRVEMRMHEVAADLLRTDKKWHDRLAALQSRGTSDYHIDTDVVLKYIGGTTRVLSEMLTAMSAYVTATKD